MRKMRQNPVRKFLYALLVVLLVAVSSCKKDDGNGPSILQTKTIQLSGSSEIPAVTTTGSGIADFSYNRETRTIDFTISWTLGQDASTLYMHLHGSPTSSVTEIAPPIVSMPGSSTGTTGFFTGTTRIITEEEEAQLLAGRWYLNIHSSNYESGELRGQLVFP